MRESSTLEFKREPSKTFLKTVSAFANYGTGKIVFGADDDGKPIGLDDPKATCLNIENAINDALSPVPRYTLDIDDDAKTVTLTVYEGKSKPYLASGKAYRRTDTSTVEVSRLEYNRLALSGMNIFFDALESQDQNLSFDRLEKDLIEKMGLHALDRNTLISLELMDSNGTYNNAAALLADENKFAGTDITRFGDSISVILSRRTFERMSVLLQMDHALETFDEYYVYEEIIDYQRVTKSLIPRNAFREAMANALVHRRWDINGNVKVSMYADRVEISSPGGLPDGVTEDEYLSGGLSISRNPLLANVFYRLGFIERFGTGIPRIIDEYAAMTVEPRFTVRESSITVVLPVNDGIHLTTDEHAVLAALPKGVIMPRSSIEQAAGLSKDKTIRVLNDLVKKKLVERRGGGRSTRYSRG